MDEVTVKLTVFFEGPFWVGVFERGTNGRLSACKVTFGAEPKDYEIQDFILENYYRLRFSPAVEAAKREMSVNPKRRLRETKKMVQTSGIGTKSQQALKLQQELVKDVRVLVSRERKETDRNRRFELKQQKKKAKHRGR